MGTLPYAAMIAGLKTRPGEDAHLTNFTAVEAISEPFAYNIDAVIRHAGIDGAAGGRVRSR
jgi:hypothetical protein